MTKRNYIIFNIILFILLVSFNPLSSFDRKEHKPELSLFIYMDRLIFSENEPLRDDVFKCLDEQPSVLEERVIGERIIAKMKEFVEVFIEDVAA